MSYVSQGYLHFIYKHANQVSGCDVKSCVTFVEEFLWYSFKKPLVQTWLFKNKQTNDFDHLHHDEMFALNHIILYK